MNSIAFGWKKQAPSEMNVLTQNVPSQNRSARKVKTLLSWWTA
jgi:hypothetical protein